MTYSTFSNWRLYSWRRLTCTSNIVSGFTMMPVRSLIKATSCCLQAVLDGSPLAAECRRRRRTVPVCAARLRGMSQSSPILLVISLDKLRDC